MIGKLLVLNLYLHDFDNLITQKLLIILHILFKTY